MMKGSVDAGRRHLLDFSANRPQRFPVPLHEILQGAFGHPDLGGVVLAVYRQSDLTFLEMLQDVGFGE